MGHWKRVKIQDIGTVVGGATPSTKNIANYEDGHIAWITPKDLSAFDGRYIYNGERNISDIGLKSSSTVLMPKNSILFSSRAPIGYIAIAGKELCTNQGFKSVIPNERIDYLFLYYLLKFNKDKIENLGSGTTFKEVSGSVMKNVEVMIPEDIMEQKRIAAILNSIDEKIELNNEINDNLLQQAQAIYDENCMGCNALKLESLISVIETGSRPKGGAESDGVPSIGAEKIECFGTYDFSGEKYISEEYFSKLKRGIVLSGDVLLYKDGAYTGKVSMALDGFPHKKCAVNEHVFILRTENNFAQYFLYFTLSSPSIREKVYTLACGKAAQPGLNQQELFSVEAPIPSKDVLLDFEKQVDPLMHAIALNSLENLKLSNLRDSLLPKLMSGEIDVDSIEL